MEINYDRNFQKLNNADFHNETYEVYETPSKNNKLIFDTAMLAGTILLSSGAETFRVENTMERILSKADKKSINVVALLTGLYVTLQKTDGEYISSIKRINARIWNLKKVQKVNEVSRALTEDRITTEEAYEKLLVIEKEDSSTLLQNIGIVLTGSFFTLIFAGTFFEFFLTILAGFFLLAGLKIMSEKKYGFFVSNMFSAFLASLFVGVCHLYFKEFNTARVVIASLIILYPGVTLSNGIRDIMQGDIISGTGNLVQAAITASAIAVGAAFAMSLTGMNSLELSSIGNILPAIIGTFFAVIFSAFFYNVDDSRILIYSGITGCISQCAAIYFSQLGTFASILIASIIISISAQIGARALKAPASLFLVPCIYPLVPGIAMYLMTSAFLVGKLQLGSNYAVQSIIIASAIALGYMVADMFIKIILETVKIFKPWKGK